MARQSWHRGDLTVAGRVTAFLLVVAAAVGLTDGATSARVGAQAYFLRQSAAPRSLVTLVVPGARGPVNLRVLRAGTMPITGLRRDEVNGVVVREGTRAPTGTPRRLRIRVGDWESGLYFAEVRGRAGRIGYAPLVVRPPVLGGHRVAVVMPTNTWQAYNRRDADRDGLGDTWYEDDTVATVDTTRAFLDRGVPPRFNVYDLPFLRWLSRSGKEVDVISDLDLRTVTSGARLRRAYDLIVFPGHHEYVTGHEYAVVTGYRDRGGSLMFLSANNFFYRVDYRGDRMTRVAKWRDLGRPEAALIGTQYIANDRGKHRRGFVVRATPASDWLFAGTGLEPGATFGSFGIEIDRKARASPPGTQVVAEIPNLFGRGLTAQMTYYQHQSGARVFAAGAFTLGGSALQGPVPRMLENLWSHLLREAPPPEVEPPPTEPAAR